MTEQKSRWLGGFSTLAERVGLEPTVPCGTPDFESAALILRNPPYEVRAMSIGAFARPVWPLSGRFPRTHSGRQRPIAADAGVEADPELIGVAAKLSRSVVNPCEHVVRHSSGEIG